MASNGIAKNQHYVPQFILKNFAYKKGQVNVFDKQKGMSFRTNTKNVASEKDFYNFISDDGEEYTWEVALSKLEGAVSFIIKEILAEKSIEGLSDKQKYSLAFFFSVQFVRTRHSREFFKDMTSKFFDALNQRFSGVHSLFTYEEKEEWLSDDSMKRYTAEMIDSAPEDYLDFFLSKVWTLHEAPKGQSFLIGDNPMAVYNFLPDQLGSIRLGLAVKGVEVHMPISSKMSIVMLCPILIDEMKRDLERRKALLLLSRERDWSLHNGLIELEREMNDLASKDAKVISSDVLIHANYLQVKHVNRFVYSSDSNFDLVKEMINDSDHFRTGPRGRVI